MLNPRATAAGGRASHGLRASQVADRTPRELGSPNDLFHGQLL